MGLLHTGAVAATVVAFACAAPATGLGAIATVSTTNATNGNTKNFAISPAAVTGGNFLVAHIVLNATTTAPTGPNGWTLRNTSSSAAGNLVLTTWTHTVTAGETPTYTWNYAASNMAWAGGITQYSGVDIFCPVGATGTANGTSVTVGKQSTFALPVITTVGANSVTDGGYGVVPKNRTFTPPTGWTLRVAARRAAGSPTAGSSNRVQAAAGSTGTNTVIVNATANPYVADIIELDAADAIGLTLAPTTMSFSTNQGSNPASQTFTITNVHTKPGCANDTYTASVGSFSTGWGATELPAPNVAAVSLAKGATSGAITVSVASSAMSSGTYTALITITDGRGNTATISVILVVNCGNVTRRGNVATGSASAATTLTLTEPGGWNNGDVVVASLSADTTTAPATPAGWSLIGSATTGGNLGQWVYKTVKNGSATTTWNGFVSGKLAGAMAAFSGVNDVTPINAPPTPFAPAPTGSGDGNVDTNACTTAGINTEIVAVYAINAASAGTGLTPGSGLTSITGNVSTGGGIGDVVLNIGSDLIVPAAGTVLAETGSVAPSQSASKLGALFAINPKLSPPAMSVSRVPVNPIQGDTVTYTIVVTNPASNVPIGALMMSDTLPAGVTFVSLTANAAGAGLTLSANAGAGAVEGAYGTLTTPLAGGGSVVFTLVGTVGCGAVAAQSSTVFAYTDGTCGAPASMLDAFTPGVVATPAVTVSRTPAVPTQGDTVTYAITVQNTNATAPLNALVLSDTLPAGVTFVSLTADSAGNGLTMSANAGAGAVEGAYGTLTTPLAAGDSITFTLVGTVGCAAGGVQSNQAYVQTPSNCKNAVSAADSFTPAAVNAAPTVTVSHTPATPAPEGSVTYMITVVNNSTAALNTLTISDTLPAGVDFVSLEGGSDGSGDGLTMSANAGAGAVEGVSGTFTSGLELASGASFTLTLTGTVTCAASGAQSHQAYAQTASNCRNGLSAADSFTVPTVALSVVKTQVTPAAGTAITVGIPVMYRIVVTNTGVVTLTSLMVVDTVGPQVVNLTTTATGFALPAVADSVGGAGTVYAWSGTGLVMGPNWSYTFTISGQAGTACASVVVGNTAYVSGGNACGPGLVKASAASGTFTLGPPAINVSVAKVADVPFAGIGEPVTYRVIVTNTGDATVASVTVSDTVSPVIVNRATMEPPGFGAPTVTSIAGTGTRYVWSATGLTLYPGSGYTFTITGRIGPVCASTPVDNAADIGVADACGNGKGATTGTASFTVAPAVHTLDATLAQDPAAPQIGESITYRIVVRNTGAATVTGVIVIDTVSPVLRGVTTAQPAGFAAPAVASIPLTGTRYTWSANGLALLPGATYTFTITGSIGIVCAATNVASTAYAATTTACGSLAGLSNPVGHMVLAPVSAVSVGIIQTPPAPGVGEPVVLYQIDVTNSGTATLTALTVTDTVSPVLTGISTTEPGGWAAPSVTSVAGAGTRYEWSLTGFQFVPGETLTFWVGGSMGLVCADTAVTNRTAVWGPSACATVRALSAEVGGTVAAPVTALTVTKEQSPAAPGIGDPVTYRIVAANTGTATLISLTVSDTVAPEITGIAANAPAAMGVPVVTEVAGVGTRYVWSAGSLSLLPGTSWTFTITGKAGVVCAVTPVGNKGFVQAVSDCATTEGVTNAVSFNLAPSPVGIAATVELSPPSPGVGDPVTYRVIVTNNGAATVTALDVTDTIAPVVTGAIADQPGGWSAPTVTSVVGGSRYVWSAAGLSLNPGKSFTFTITGGVGLVCGVLTAPNRAHAAAVTLCADTEALSNTPSFTVDPPMASITAAKEQSPVSPGVGEPVTYRMVLANTGTATLTELTVVDTVSPVVTGATVDAPAVMGAPTVTSVTGGTRYLWSRTGITMYPGTVWTFTVSGTVGAVCSATAITNTAYAMAGAICGGADAYSNRVQFLAAPATAGMAVVADQSPSAPVTGEAVTYRIVVTNTGATTLSGLTVIDTVSPVVVGASADQPGGWSAPTVTPVVGGTRYEWTATGLVMYPGATYTFTIAGLVGQVCSAVTVANRAHAAGSDSCVGLNGVTAATSFSIDPATASIAAVKEQSPVSPGVGEPVTYRMVLANTGTATLTELTVVDTVSPVVTGATTDAPAVMGAPTVTSVAGGTRYLWSRTGITMYPGTVWTFTVSGTVGAVCSATAVTNTGFVIGFGPCGGADAYTNRVEFTVAPAASAITVAKEQSPASPGVGEPVTYRIIVTNTGASTISGLTVIDTVSPVVTGASADQPGGWSAPSVTSTTGGTLFVWNASGLDLVSGAGYTFTITGMVGPVCAETAVTGTAYVVAATSCGPQADGYSNRVEFTVAPPAAAMTVMKEQSPASPPIGEPVTYRIIVTNTGEATISALAVMDTVSPVIVGVVTGEPAGFGSPTVSTVGTGTLYVWSASGLSLGCGASYTFTISGSVGFVCSATTVTNTAYVVASGCAVSLDGFTNRTEFTVNPAVIAVEAVKEQSPASPQVGEQVTYRIIVTNNGTATVDAITVTDTVSSMIVSVGTAEPAGFVSPTVASIAGAGTLYVWAATGLNLASGASYTFTITGLVGPVCTATSVSNTACVTASAGCAAAQAQTNAVGHAVQPPSAAMVVTKEQSPASPQVGEPVTYRIIVTNTGAATINNMTVTDTVSPVIVDMGTAEPSGFGGPTIVSIAGTGTEYSWSASGLGMAWGTSLTFTITGKVGPVCGAVVVTNTAYIVAGPACGIDTSGYTNRVEFQVGPAVPMITLVREQEPAQPGVGEPVTYRIVVTNTGGATLAALTVTDTISPVIVNVGTGEPSGFAPPTVASIVGTGTRYAWSASGLAMRPGTAYTFTTTGLVGFVCAATAVSGTGYATAEPVCGIGATASANLTSFTVAPAAPAIAVTKALITSPAGIGEAVAYRLVVTNVGGATIDSLTMVDTVSPVVTGIATGEPSGWPTPTVVSIAGTGSRYEWSATGLDIGWGQGYTFTISGKVGLVCAATFVDNSACATGADICLNGTGGVSSPVGFTVAPHVTDIAVTKQQDPAAPAVGDTVTYRLIVVNTGASTIADLTVTDTVSPTIVEAASDQPPAWAAPVVGQVSGGTRYAWNGTGLAMLPGAVYTFTITGKVGPVCVQSTVSNTAYVTAAAGCPAVGKYSNRTDFLVTAPILGFTVVAEQVPAAFGVGEPVVYRIVVANTGAITIENMTILDTVSPVLTGTTIDQPAGWSPVVTSVSGGTRYEWSRTGLSMFPGADFTFTISGKAGLVCAATQVSNTVYVSAGTACASQDAFTPATGSEVLSPAEVLSVENTQTPANPGVGSAVTYRIVVTNAGQATVESLTLTDTLSPVVVSASTDQPSGWSTPTIVSIAGAGTRYAWSAAGLNMTPGTAYTFTITGAVGLVCVNTSVGNTAYAAGRTACGGIYEYSNGTGFMAGAPVVSLAAVREQDPASPQIGEALTYRIVVTNTGTATLENLAVVDTVSPVLTGAKTDQPAGWAVPVITQAANGTRYEWSYGSALGMTPGTAYTFTVTGMVGLVCSPTPVTGTAYAFGGKACGEAAVLTNGTFFDVTPPTPGIAITKEQDPAAPGIGEPVTYRIIVVNTGTSTVTALTVTDTVSPVITGITADQPTGFPVPVVTESGSGSIYAWTGAGLFMAPGASHTFTISGAVGPVCVLTAVGDRAFGTAGAPCGSVDAASLVPTFNVSPPATSISVVKEQDVPVPGIGEPVAYRIMVANTGGTTIETLTVVDTVSPVIVNVLVAEPSVFGAPAITSIVGAGTRYVWTAAGLGMIPGTTYTFTIAGRIGLVCSATGVSNTAYAAAAPACGNRIEGFSGVVGFAVAPPLTSIAAVKEQVPASPGVGEAITYRIVVENTGTATLTALTVTDTVAPVIVNAVVDQPGGWSAPTLTQEGEGTRYVWSKAGLSMTPGSVCTFTISGEVGAVCGSIAVTNTACVAASSDCAVVTADTNRVEFGVAPQALAFTVTKEIDPAAPGTGESVTYRIVVANTGGVTIDGLVVTDTVSPVIVNASTAEPSGFAVPTVTSIVGTGSIYAWSAAGIGMNPGTSYTFTVTGRIGPVCAPTTVDNAAYGAAVSACSAAETSASAAGFTVMPAVTAVMVTAEQEPVAPQIGEAVTYRIVVENTGTATLTALTVTDTVAPVVTGASADQPVGWSAPAVTSVAGGTRYLWSGTGLFMVPGTTYTFTIAGRIGLVCAGTAVASEAYAVAADHCAGAGMGAGTPGFTVNPPLTAITVARERTPASPGVGDAVTYRIIVANTGTATVTDLAVVDTISAVIVGTSADQPVGWSAPAVVSVSGGTRFVWSGAGLAMTPGSVYTFTIMGSAGSVCVQTTITGTTFAAAASACGPVSAFSNMTWFVIAGQDLAYTATVEQFPAVPMIGEPLAYRIVVMNTGGVTIENLTVMDTVTPIILGASTGEPSGFAPPTIVSIVGTGTLYVWEATGLNMVPNTVYTFTVAGTAGPVCVDTGIANQALVFAGMSCDSAELDSNTVNSTIAAPIRSLAVVKSQEPASPGIGEAVAYRIVVTNTGQATIESLDLTDTVSPVIVDTGTAEPSGFGLPITTSVIGTGTRYVWSATGLNMIPGTTYTFTVTGKVGLVCAATPVGGQAHAAGISACATTDVISNTAGSTVQPPVTTVSAVMEQAPASATVGVEVVYRIIVANTGGMTVDRITVTDTVQPEIMVTGTAEPSGFGPPTIVPIVGMGTKYEWAATGLNMVPGTVYTFTVTGRIGTVCGTVHVGNTAWVSAGADCTVAGQGTNGTGFDVDAPAAHLTAAVSAPLTVVQGRWFELRLTVTNTGSMDASAVTPSVTAFVGESRLSNAAGPVPASAPILAIGGSATFAYTFTASGRGLVVFTATAEGTTCSSASILGVAQVSVTLLAPAALAAGVAVSPAVTGQNFTVTVTVANTGDIAANGISVPAPSFAGSGAVSLVSGANPATLATLAGGQAATFTWVYAATAPGSAVFSTGATGTDSESSNPLATGTVSSAASTISLPAVANLIATSFTAGPARIEIDRIVTVTFTVQNTGWTAATGLTPALAFTGNGSIELVSSPAVITLAAGATGTFTWTYRTLAGGSLAFNVSAISSNGASVTASAPANIVIFEAGTSVDQAEVYPLPFDPATALGGTLKFRRMPAFTTVRIYTIAGEIIAEATADANGLVEWDGRNKNGSKVTGGVYFYMLKPPQGKTKVGKLEVGRGR